MFAKVDGASPRYIALTPHILAPRHIPPPSKFRRTTGASVTYLQTLLCKGDFRGHWESINR